MLDNRIHFIAGLPRSGSTLLAAILRQNPSISAGMSSPLARLFTTMLVCVGGQDENALFLDDHRREDLLRGVFESYYRRTPHSIILDTNRAWCGRMSAIARIFPQARVIACVRELPWILDSFERLIQKNPYRVSRMSLAEATPVHSSTVYSRAEMLMSPNGTVGFSYNCVREAFYGDFSSRLMLIDYDKLAREPQLVLRRIYEFLQLREFTHDFDTVDFRASVEFDQWMGMPGLHDVSGRVEFIARDTILPPDLFARYQHQPFWRGSGSGARSSSGIVLTSEFHGDDYDDRSVNAASALEVF